MSGGVFLLDTNIVLALVRGKELGRHLDRTYRLRESKTRPLMSVVTHGEVRVLAARNRWGDQKTAALRNALNSLVTVDINHPTVIEAYVEIDLYSQGHADGARNMGKNDLWIAACAKAAGATLLTTDNDFAHLAPALLAVEVVPVDVATTS